MCLCVAPGYSIEIVVLHLAKKLNPVLPRGALCEPCFMVEGCSGSQVLSGWDQRLVPTEQRYFPLDDCPIRKRGLGCFTPLHCTVAIAIGIISSTDMS